MLTPFMGERDAKKTTFEEWLVKHNFKKFANDEQDGFDADFIDSLMASLLGGYDPDHPIIRADSNDPEIKGEVVDGRHRLYVCYLAETRKGIRIDYKIIETWVEDVDELDIKQAYYDKLSESKDRRASQKRQEKNFNRVLDRHPELDSMPKIWQFFSQKGWKDQLTLDFFLNKQVEKRTKNGSSKPPKTEKPLVPVKNDESNGEWVTPEDGSTGKRFTCDCCDSEYELFIKDNAIVGQKLLKKGVLQH